MNTILNIISFVATLIVAEGALYFVMDLVFGNIKLLNKAVALHLQVKHLLFYSIGLVLLFSFTKFHQPW